MNHEFSELRIFDEIWPTLSKILSSNHTECYLVGGFIRDYLLRRPTLDSDFALKSHPKEIAQEAARRLKGAFFALKEEREIYRVTLQNGFQIDFAKYKGETIAEDLALRDFSINAMAVRIDSEKPLSFDKILDPYDGQEDLKSKTVRQIAAKIYDDDPLRLLRAFRIAAQLNFDIDPGTFQSIKSHASKISQPAPERIRTEICLTLDSPHSYSTILKMDEAGLLSHLIPEIDPNRKCAEDYYPGKGVWGHSLDGFKNLEWILENIDSEFPEDSAAIKTFLAAPESSFDNHPLTTLMKFAILLHDVGKASTAKMIDGRMRFHEHEYVGSRMVKRISQRLKFSADFTRHVAELVGSHMRPGSLAHAPELTEKAKYRFFRSLDTMAIPMMLVSLADRYSYLTDRERGKKSDLHERSTKELIRWHYEKKLAEIKKKPKLINGNILMQKFKLPPGKLIGEILKHTDELQALGDIKTPEEALAAAEQWIRGKKS